MIMCVRIKFEWRDLWVGAFIDSKSRCVYVCLVPCFPVIFSFPHLH